MSPVLVIINSEPKFDVNAQLHTNRVIEQQSRLCIELWIANLSSGVFRKYPDRAEKLQSLYIRRGTPFPELEMFITKSAER